LRAGTNLLDSFDYDLVARIQAFGDNPVAANAVARDDRADRDFVVGTNDSHLVISLQLGNGALRNDQGVFLCANDSANSAIATGPQNVCRIWEQASEADGPGAFVDLAIGEIKRALVRVYRTVGQNELKTEGFVGLYAGFFRGETLAPSKILRFTNSKVDLYRINGRNRSDGAAGGTNQGTHLKESLAGDAINWSNEASKLQIDLCGFDRRFVGLNLGLGSLNGGQGREIVLDRIVEVLLAGGLFLGQRGITVYVELCATLNCLCVGKHGFGLSQLSLGLVQRGLKRTGVNLKKQLALFDERAFQVALLHQVARDLSPNVGVDKSVERANPFPVDRNIVLPDLNDLNFRRLGSWSTRNPFGPYSPNNECYYEQ